jgi:hypothetical protein
MIQIEQIKTVPPEMLENLSEYAKYDLKMCITANPQVFETSLAMWYASDDGDPLCVWGIRQISLLGMPRLWFLTACKEGRDTIRLLAEARGKQTYLLERWPIIQTVVECDFLEGHRFARFFGFKPTEMYIEVSDRRHRVYEARR